MELSPQEQEILRLRETFGALTAELVLLERRLRTLEVQAAKERHTPAASQAAPAAISPHVIEERETRGPGTEPAEPHRAPLPEKLGILRGVAEQIRSTPQVEKQSEGMEMRIGATWFNRIGAILLLLGVAFFVKYSFDQGFIGPLTRVLLGAGTGLAIIGAGEFALRRGMRQFAVGMIGAGIGMLYMSTFSAHSFYELITTDTAFGLYVAITVLSTILSVHANMQALAVIAIVGAFITPLAVSKGRNAQVELMTYLLFVDIGFLLVGQMRRWDTPRVLCWAGTALLFLGWTHRYYEQAAINQTLWFLAAFYVVFLAESWSASLRNRACEENVLALLIHLTNATFFGTTYYLAQDVYSDWMGTFALVTGLVQWLLAWMIRSGKTTQLPGLFALAHDGAAMVALAAPLQFDGRSVPIAWSLQALVGCIFARWVTSSWLRIKIVAILAAAGAHLAMFGRADESLTRTMMSYPLWHLNGFLLCAAMVSGCAFGGAAALTIRRKVDNGEEMWACALAAIGLLVLLGSISDQYDRYVATLCWLAIVLITRLLRPVASVILALGVVVMVVTIGKFLAWDLVEAAGGYWKNLHGVLTHRAMVTALAVSGFAVLMGASLRKIPQEWISEGGTDLLGMLLILGTPVVLVAAGTFEIFRVFHFEDLRHRFASSGRALQTTLSIFWSISATALLIIGMARSVPPLRYMAIGLFGVTVLKLLLVDLSYLNVLYRVISFIALGVLLLLASLMYQRRSQRMVRSESQQSE
jgi:uncharacterized membrane protein